MTGEQKHISITSITGITIITIITSTTGITNTHLPAELCKLSGRARARAQPRADGQTPPRRSRRRRKDE